MMSCGSGFSKFWGRQGFRKTHLENPPPGRVPGSLAGDYNDVNVVTPYGEIPWSKLSRLNDEEMKVLMIEVVNKTYTFLSMLFASGPATIQPILDGLEKIDLVPYWNEPETTKL